MQMFGVGPLELLVILFLAVIVVGPDRLPAVAADLARWIRRTRAYAQHLTRDFSDVVSELEKEAGASREDWKEIASLVTRHTGDIGKELDRTTSLLEGSSGTDLEGAKSEPDGDWTNVVPFEPAKSDNGTSNGNEPPVEETGDKAPAEDEQQPWYAPQRSSRRRPRE